MNSNSPSPRRALITGIGGQDGGYLAELLTAKNYRVIGIAGVGVSEQTRKRLDFVRTLPGVELHDVSLNERRGLWDLIRSAAPDECYHMAAKSFVSYELEDDFSLLDDNIRSTHHMLAGLRQFAPACRFYFATSSEMFGIAEESPQNEHSRFRPRALYGISKLAGYELTRNYREKHGLHASAGITFNHESPRRGHQYVTRKITSAVARILAGQIHTVRLGNLEARRDWGHARDYARAMWLMLQQATPDDYVIATGETHTVREFAEAAFVCAGLDYRSHVETDPAFYRQSEELPLCGDATKARAQLGWQATVRFEELVREMVEADCAELGVKLNGAVATGLRASEQGSI